MNFRPSTLLSSLIFWASLQVGCGDGAGEDAAQGDGDAGSGGLGDGDGSGAGEGTGATGSGGASSGGGGGGGLGGTGDSGGSGGRDPVDPNLVQVHVAVGYSGVKMRSFDGGLTWSEPQVDPDVGTPEEPGCVGDGCSLLCTGGDDRCLLRDVTFAEGLFVAVGWKIFSSPDGNVWEERTLEGQQWMGGVEFGNDLWLAVGGCGMSLSSADGITWAQGTNASEGCGHVRELAFGAGTFVATGAYNTGDLAGTAIGVRATDDSGWTPIGEPDLDNFVDFVDGSFVSPSRANDAQHYTSPDGVDWDLVDAPLPPKSLGGVYLRGRNGRIERSENGVDFTPVTEELPGAISGFAVGMIPVE